MERSLRFRLVLAAPLLAMLYLYLLLFFVGSISAQIWPSWWFGLFPSRHVAGVTWIVILHTTGVLSAAFPVAFAVVLIVRREAVLLGSIVGLLATSAAVIPSLSPKIWPLLWSTHPIFFVTDHIKFLLAVPFAVWLLRRLSESSVLPTSALRQRV